MRVRLYGAWLSLAGVCALTALASATTPKVQFTDTRLKNGLRVIISEDHTAPVFSIAVTYNVGSRDERKGRTGFAHLFEHMMFKGSQNVGSGEHFLLIFNNGGDMNGRRTRTAPTTTSACPPTSSTSRCSSRPTACARSTSTRRTSTTRSTRCSEERRQGVDNQPYGRTFEAIDELMYDQLQLQALGHRLDGRPRRRHRGGRRRVLQDLLRPQQRRARPGRRREDDEALAKVRQYFESIPSQPPPPAPTCSSRRRPREAARASTIRSRGCPRSTSAGMPPSLTPDADALSVLARSSRAAAAPASTRTSSGRSSWRRV
jgi:zinc protease